MFNFCWEEFSWKKKSVQETKLQRNDHKVENSTQHNFVIL